MGFKPYTQSGFKPISEAEPSMPSKIAGILGESTMQTLNIPFELAGEALRLPREGKPITDFQAPTGFGGHPSDVAEELARWQTGAGQLITGQGLEKAKQAVAMKPNPILTAVTGALIPLPMGKAKAVSSMMKAEKSIEPEIAASKMIAGKLQNSSIENLANPFVNKVAHSPNLAVKTEELVQDAANSFKEAYDSIKQIQSNFYKNAGVTDNLVVNVDDALANMNAKVSKYAESAIGTADEKAIIEASKIVGDITAKSKNGTLTFGQIKKMKDTLYSIGESNVTETGRHTPVGVLFKQLGHDLTEAQKAIPQIAQAGDKYKDLLEAEDLMNQATRLDRYTGEINLAKKIKNRYTDIGNEDWKNSIAKAEEIFKRHPESKEFADFNDKIKAAHLALDVQKAKAVLPTGIGRIPMLKYLGNMSKVFDPQFQVNMLARYVKKGTIKPESLSSMVKESQIPIGGASITKMRALKEIFKEPYQAAKGVAKKGTIQSGMGIRALLSSQRGEQNGNTKH